MPKLHSFDIFDTCILRNYAFPTDLFLTLAVSFQQTLEPLLGRDYKVIFRDTRVDAEVRALSRANGRETTIREIWIELVSMLPGLDVDTGIKEELAAERRALRANPHVRELVNKTHDLIGRVIFISDTYLPQDFICDLLTEHGFLQNGDSCYVSSSLGVTKRSGRLFNHVLATENLLPSNLHHFGDDYTSDYVMPSRLGITAELFRDIKLSHIEKTILKTTQGSEAEFVSRLVGEMRYFRLSGTSAEHSAERHFVASFMGPFLFLFACWVLTRAKQDGVNRLYFFSRDGYALWRVASTIAKYFGHIECHYLQVSRQALFLPTVTEISPTGMPWMRRDFERQTLGRLLAKLELTVESAGPSFGEWAGRLGDNFELKTERDWERFWTLLNQEPLRGKILELAYERRIAALQYFKEKGFFDGKDSAVVDLGWLLGCQGALRDLLRTVDPTANIRGYYLGLHRNRRSVIEAGVAHAMFYAPPGDRYSNVGRDEVFERVVILEHLLGCAPHGTVHHYELIGGDGKIKVCCGNVDEIQAAIMQEIVEFSEIFADMSEDILNILPINVQDYLNHILVSSLNNPDVSWGKLVGKVQVSQDQNNIGEVPLGIPLTWFDFLFMNMPKKLHQKTKSMAKRRYWPELSHIMSDKKLMTVLRIRNLSANIWREIKKILV